jgi:membrane-associated progesterone receptor component
MDFLLQVARTTPINLILIIPIVYLLHEILFPRSLLASGSPIPSSYEESYLWRPKAHPPSILWKKYSPQTLQVYDGKRNPRIILAINRVVYDVTAGKSFYGPGQRAQDARHMNRVFILSFNRWAIWEFCWSRCFEGNGEAVF